MQRQQHLAQVDRRRQAHRGAVRHEGARPGVVSRSCRGSESMSSAACLKRSYSCRRRTSSARGSPSSASSHRSARQQHARFDLGQDRGHHQVFGGQLEAQVLHHADVFDVLARDLGDRDVEDVEVLAADQVQQQVERALEGIEDDFERVGRDVQVLRDLQHGLAMHHRQRHFLLLGRMWMRMQWGGCAGSGVFGHSVSGPLRATQDCYDARRAAARSRNVRGTRRKSSFCRTAQAALATRMRRRTARGSSGWGRVGRSLRGVNARFVAPASLPGPRRAAAAGLKWGQGYGLGWPLSSYRAERAGAVARGPAGASTLRCACARAWRRQRP